MKQAINYNINTSGMYRAKLIADESDIRAFIPGIHSKNPFNENGELLSDINIKLFPKIQWCCYNLESKELDNIKGPAFVMFENGDITRPVCVSYAVIGGNGNGDGGVNYNGGGNSSYFTFGSSYDKYIIIGDSRTVQLVNYTMDNGKNIPNNECYICLGAMAYNWFATGKTFGSGHKGYDKNVSKSVNASWNVIESIESSIIENSAVVILMGANDGGVFNYGKILDTKAKEWTEKGATVYFCEVGPIRGSGNTNIEKFNTALRQYCENNQYVKYYDLYSDIEPKYPTNDNIHYMAETYQLVHDKIIALKNGKYDVITLDDISNLDKKSYLELVMPIFKDLCTVNGVSDRNVLLKYPGVFALQPFYEVNTNFPRELSNVAKTDNNLGGLKYNSNIPGATKGLPVPKNETGGNYCHFENISDYFYAQIWQAKSPKYELSHGQQQSVTTFTRTFLNIWVKGNFAVNNSPVAYSESLLSDYSSYNLSDYENLN